MEAKRILAHRIFKKEPITPEILTNLVDKFAKQDAELDNVRIVINSLLGFTGFLCFSELEALKESDLQVFDDHLELFIESSKTDQYGDGVWVTIAHTGSRIIPIGIIQCYIKLADITASPILWDYLYQ